MAKSQRHCGWILVAGGAVALLGGCDSGSNETPAPPDPNAEVALVAQRPRIEYTYPPALREKHPDIAPFVDEVLETVIRGDYPHYRELVARQRSPESQERFDLIRDSVRRIAVTAIDEVKLPEAPPPVYRVLTGFELDPQSKAAQQIETRAVAILVFREAGDWRMVFAPPAYQPRQAPTTAPTTQPTDEPNLPDYPWDEGVDY